MYFILNILFLYSTNYYKRELSYPKVYHPIEPSVNYNDIKAYSQLYNLKEQIENTKNYNNSIILEFSNNNSLNNYQNDKKIYFPIETLKQIEESKKTNTSIIKKLNCEIDKQLEETNTKFNNENSYYKEFSNNKIKDSRKYKNKTKKKEEIILSKEIKDLILRNFVEYTNDIYDEKRIEKGMKDKREGKKELRKSNKLLKTMEKIYNSRIKEIHAQMKNKTKEFKNKIITALKNKNIEESRMVEEILNKNNLCLIENIKNINTKKEIKNYFIFLKLMKYRIVRDMVNEYEKELYNKLKIFNKTIKKKNN